MNHTEGQANDMVPPIHPTRCSNESTESLLLDLKASSGSLQSNDIGSQELLDRPDVIAISKFGLAMPEATELGMPLIINDSPRLAV